MVHTFATHEDAAIFASAMRAKGYHSQVLDEGMASIHGTSATRGVRVMVSRESLGNDDASEESETALPPPPAAKPDGEFLTLLRLFVVGVTALGLILSVIQVISAYSGNPGGLLWDMLDLLKFPLIIGLAFAVMGPFMESFTRFVRGDLLKEGRGCLRWLLLAFIIPFLLLVVL